MTTDAPDNRFEGRFDDCDLLDDLAIAVGAIQDDPFAFMIDAWFAAWCEWQRLALIACGVESTRGQ
jgi:hypothetical protein